MGYTIIYSKKKRSYIQKTLDDYGAVNVEIFNQYLDDIEQEKWELKKQWILSQKSTSKKSNIPLKRGRPLKRYATKSRFYMNKPADVAEVKKFEWFQHLWHQHRKTQSLTIDKKQFTLPMVLDRIFPHSSITPRFEDSIPIPPRFHMPKYTLKEDYCDSMTDWVWESIRPHNKHPGFAAFVFYLNDFTFFDDFLTDDSFKWAKKAEILPSDVIKYELYRLLAGFISFQDYFKFVYLLPNFQDHLAISMTHPYPVGTHFTEKLKLIGPSRIREFFNLLVAEARDLGLIRDRVHIWDGQFHEAWMKKNIVRKESLEPFFGGIYNHGGKKVGIGVYQSTIFDWNGYCMIPINTEIVLANVNENIAVRDIVTHTYSDTYHTPEIFITDKGPSGLETQETIASFGPRPIIPIHDNITKNARVTSDGKLRFYSKFVEGISDANLRKIYNLRTRVEEQYSFNDNLYRTGQLHCYGKDMIEIEILLINILGVLIPLTGYKIGRPDMMWRPSDFESITFKPSEAFPKQYEGLKKERCDDRFGDY